MKKKQSWLAFINPGNDVDFGQAKPKKTNVQREGILQAQCVQWFRIQYPTLLLVSSVNGAVLQGTKEQRARRWKVLEKEGAVAGSPDLFLFLPNAKYHGLCIEMKQGDGKQSEKQKLFQQSVTKSGYCYVVCRTFAEFQDVIQTYLYDGRTNNTVGNGQIFDSEK